MKLINLTAGGAAQLPLQPEPMPRRWLEAAAWLCEERDCHANAVMTAVTLQREHGVEDVHVVTGIVREDASGWSFDHSWIRIGATHYDPTADLFWPEGQRERASWLAIIERVQGQAVLAELSLPSALAAALME